MSVIGRLKYLGIDENWKIPLYLPNSFLDCRRPTVDFRSALVDGQKVVIAGSLIGKLVAEKRNKIPITKGELTDSKGNRLRFTHFGDSRKLQTELSQEKESFLLSGTISIFAGRPYLNNPEILDDGFMGIIVPCYPGKPGKVAPDNVRKLIHKHLSELIPETASKLRGILSEITNGRQLREAVKCYDWTLEDVLLKAHYPEGLEESVRAHYVLERVAAIISVTEMRRTCAVPEVQREPLIYDSWEKILEGIPFRLTEEQVDGVKHFIGCFRRPHTSSTLINADVGMGKSAVYQSSIAYVVKAGGRAAVLLPHQRLAEQAFGEINSFWPELHPVLVNGKCRVEDLLQERLLVGTTALLHRDIGDFDVCVCDEQQRFSVDQRKGLVKAHTHTIELSATPIPRTQALLTYGKMNVVRLTERHSPQDIQTHIITNNEVWDMVSHIKGLIANGSRILIVCPKKETAEEEASDYPLPSVEQVAEKWEKLFPGLVRIAHSGTDSVDLEKAYSDIDSGKAQILCCTTVVETGITLRETRGIIVVHADRFGVSQLHQLRGRLARHGGYGVCYLYLPRPVKEATMERLLAVANTNDGFKLAELDMRLRGVGDLSRQGAKQHGSADSIIYNKQISTDLISEIVELLRE